MATTTALIKKEMKPITIFIGLSSYSKKLQSFWFFEPRPASGVAQMNMTLQKRTAKGPEYLSNKTTELISNI